MNRRELVKSLALGGTAILTLKEGNAEVKAEAPPAMAQPCPTGTAFPDTIVSMVNFEDTVIVACEHSVWQLYKDHNLGMMTRTLLFTM